MRTLFKRAVLNSMKTVPTIQATKNSRRRLSAIVEQRCKLLGLQSVCPYVAAQMPDVEFPAYLPQFGGRAGLLIDVVIDPDFTPSELHQDAARKLGIPISFINPISMFEDSKQFIDLLIDWQFSGNPMELRDDTKALLLNRSSPEA